jgi:hypothetical protein
MMTAKEFLAFLYPRYSTTSEADVEVALRMAEDYIAACLSEAKQLESQALYAAYLLESKDKRENGDPLTTPAGPLIQEKEGQLERRYADPGLDGNNYVDHSYYGRWKALYDSCAFGAIVTRFG